MTLPLSMIFFTSFKGFTSTILRNTIIKNLRKYMLLFSSSCQSSLKSVKHFSALQISKYNITIFILCSFDINNIIFLNEFCMPSTQLIIRGKSEHVTTLFKIPQKFSFEIKIKVPSLVSQAVIPPMPACHVHSGSSLLPSFACQLHLPSPIPPHPTPNFTNDLVL